jgi:hypothetical protein
MKNFFCRCDTITTGGYATLFRSGFKTSPRTQSSIFAIATTGQAVLD